MENSYEQEIKSKIDALPPKTRDLIYSADMDAILGSIGTKHHLHIDQIGSLGTEAVAVMVGLSESKDFVANVAEALRVDEQLASTMVADVNAMLFVKIQDAMKTGATSIETSVQKPPLSSVLPVTPAPQSAPVIATPAPVSTPAPAVQTPTTLEKPASVPAIDLSAADMMLSQKTVSAPATTPTTTTPAAAPKPDLSKSEPPKPGNYKTDPYREPVE